MIKYLIILFGFAFSFWAVKYPKKFLYFYIAYHILTPLYFMNLLNSPNKDLATSGGIHLDFMGGFTGNTILLILLILILLEKMLNTRYNIKQFFKLPGFHFLFIYTILIIAIVILQYLFFDISFSLTVKKIAGNITFPLFMLNLLFYFTYKDNEKLLKFIIFLFIIVFSVFFIDRFIPYLSTLSGINFNNRLFGLLYYGANGTAAFLGVFLPIIFYKYKFSTGGYRILWLFLFSIISICIFFTFTRAVFIALIFSLLAYEIFLNKNMNEKVLFLALLILIFVSIGSDSLLNIFTRGQQDIMSNLSDQSSSTFAYRINRYWLPTLNIVNKNATYFLTGTPFRGFNEFLYVNTGVNRANHNIFIKHLAQFGIIVTIIYGLFWYKLLITILKKVKTNIMNFQLVKFIFLSLMIFFISINSMNIYNPPLLNSIAILIFIFYSDIQKKQMGKSSIANK